MKTKQILTAVSWLALVSSASAQPFPGGVPDAFGPGFAPRPPREQQRPPQPPTRPSDLDGATKRWNQIAIDASGLDHTPVADGEERVYGEQLGPCRASRAIAIVHVAMFEAANASDRKYPSYVGLTSRRGNAAGSLAVAQAAHDALVSMFPSQSERFDAFLAEDLAAAREGAPKEGAVALGRAAATEVLARRAGDGSDHEEPVLGVDYFTSSEAGRWRQDPISQSPIALGALWSTVSPFVLESADQFRLPPPPAPNSLDHSMAFVEVKRLGGDGITTPTERSEEEEEIGIFWAYDGTPSLCAPPRLYNQLLMRIASQQRTTGIELLRLLALANVAMADTAIAAWESKYHHDLGRPVTVIREAALDENADTAADPTFTPLGAPASNLSGPNFTPPFPSYPSGHAAFGGALFQTLRRYYGRDDIAFTFISDEFNGITTDNEGNVRPVVERSFFSLSEAELENAESRIYLGIHWNYDASGGIQIGNQVADWVFDRLYPRGGKATAKAGQQRPPQPPPVIRATPAL